MHAIKKIFRLILPYKGWFALNILFNLLVAIFTVFSIPALVPLLRILFDMDAEVPVAPQEGLSSDNFLQYIKYEVYHLVELYGKEQVMIWLCIGLSVVFLLKNVFRYLSLFAIAPIRNGVVRDLRQGLLVKILVLPVGFFSEEKKGNLLSRFSSDTAEIEHSILAVLEALFRSPIIVVGSLAYMVYVSPMLTLYVVVLVTLLGAVIGRIASKLKRKSFEAQSKLGNIVSLVEEAISGQKVVKGFGAEKYVYEKFKTENDTFKGLLDRISWRRDSASPISEFFGVVVLSLLLWVGSRAIFYEGVDPTFFLTFLFAFFNVIEPAKQFSNATFNLRKGLAALQRIEEILTIPLHITSPANPKSIKGLQHLISFQSVTFQYPQTDQPVLKDVSFEISKGSKVAVVGYSGSGKSTLADLLPRFYDVSSGTILIDGSDIRSYALEDLRNLFGIVTQDAVLFNDTIYNNIVFGLENIHPEAVYEAAKMAFAHDFILESEFGYQTVIGDRGVKLSGGQRQRITIARAILKNPDIFILDEATSALDSESEKAVQEAIDKAMEGRTALIIAHRLSTIRHVDLIIVLDKGIIIEQGTHTSLMEANGHYARLAKGQDLT
jgi:ABC-type multidrug transport system fused ATPase/permease subunit